MRSVLAVLAGFVAAFVVVAVVELTGHLIYPPPPGIDISDPKQMATIMDKIPIGALVAVLAAWGLGTFTGSFVAAWIAGRKHLVHALIVGGLQMSMGLITMLYIPHPLWFMLASFASFVGGTFLGAKLAQLVSKPKPPAGPRPYDMREKNMAC